MEASSNRLQAPSTLWPPSGRHTVARPASAIATLSPGLSLSLSDSRPGLRREPPQTVERAVERLREARISEKTAALPASPALRQIRSEHVRPTLRSQKPCGT